MGREFIIDEIRRLYSSSSEECNELLCDKGYTKLKITISLSERYHYAGKQKTRGDARLTRT